MNLEEAGRGKYQGWSKKGRCHLSIKVDNWG